MMKKIFGFLLNRWFLLALGLIALAVLIWFVGPLVAIGEVRPLDPVWARIALIGLIVLLIALKKAWNAWRVRKANDQMAQGLTAQAAAPETKAGSEDVAVFEARFKEALLTLRQSKIGGRLSIGQRFSGGYLYQLPWYVFIGAPGSGKTTSLVNSGLEFPLAEKFGKDAIKGVGGTRNCDWWFTNEAILLDTAGRYTTQDSHRDEDAAAWHGFLQLLRKNRPRRPINGVLVTASVQDLLSLPASERERHATAVRKRVAELYEQLGLRIPIYLLVTKTDLLPGFIEYFEPLGKEEREQVCGFTIPYGDGKPLTKDVLVATFVKEFGAIQKRLFDGMIDRMEAERDPQRRAAVYGFPQQFAGLKEVLGEFVTHAFAPSSYEDAPMLRGVYFTSGTQEDSPIDRIMGVLARAFKVEKRILPPQKSTGRSYFITRLLRDVIFKEAELAGTNLKWERRRALLQGLAFVAIGVIGLAAILGWAYSYVRNQDYLAAVEAKVPAVKKVVEAFPLEPSTDVLQLLPALNELRTIAIVPPVEPDLSAPSSMKLGLFQGDKIDSAGRAAYQRLLTDALLPRITLRIEELLRSSQAKNPELMYELLKAYLMLHDSEHYSADTLRELILADWSTLPRDVTTEQRAQLEQHLEALLSRGIVTSPTPLDQNLVRDTRQQLLRMSLAQRVYSRIKNLGAAPGDIPDFTITRADVAGPSASLVFTRASGQPLTKGISWLYTYRGYHEAFEKQVDRASIQLASEEGWVLGLPEQQRTFNPKDPASALRLNGEVKRLYLEDYAKIWESFINDIRVVNQSNLQQSIQVTRALSGPTSPLPGLLRAIVKEVTLGEKFEGNQIDKAVEKARDTVQGTRESLAAMLSGNRPQAAAAQPQRIESIVDDRFAALRAYVKAPAAGQPAPVDQSVQLLGELYTVMTATETAVRGGAAPPQSDVQNKVRAEAGRLPEPVRSLLNTLVNAGVTQALTATRENLSASIGASIGDFCNTAIAGRYPFNRSSSRDVTTDDFAAMFSPGGRMDDFFQKNLIQFVDTSTKPWSFRQVGGGQMGAQGDTGSLIQFQRAQAIRDTFFRNGGKMPSLRLDFKPIEMDASITQFILDVDGQIVKYAHGPTVPMSVTWPGTAGRGQVSIQLTPPSTSGESPRFEGPWALFRLFDRAQIDNMGQPERFRATFTIDGRKAVFEVTTSSVQNPFRMSELANFSCPSKL
jgi:type VI secretion system protein ImpL